MKLIHSSPNLHEVSPLQQVLTKLGIDCQLKNVDLITAQGGVPACDIWIELWVINPDDYAGAEACVAEYTNRDPSNAPDDWTCSGCGEALKGQFDTCWKCSTTRD